MDDEMLEVLAQMYSERGEIAQTALDTFGSQSEPYILTVGARAQIATITDHYNRTRELYARVFEIDNERKGY